MCYCSCVSIDFPEWFPIEYLKENFIQLLVIFLIGVFIGFWIEKAILKSKYEDQEQLAKLLDARERELDSDREDFENQKKEFLELEKEREDEYKLFKEKSQNMNDLYAAMSSDKKFNNSENDVDF